MAGKVERNQDSSAESKSRNHTPSFRILASLRTLPLPSQTTLGGVTQI